MITRPTTLVVDCTAEPWSEFWLFSVVCVLKPCLMFLNYIWPDITEAFDIEKRAKPIIGQIIYHILILYCYPPFLTFPLPAKVWSLGWWVGWMIDRLFRERLCYRYAYSTNAWQCSLSDLLREFPCCICVWTELAQFFSSPCRPQREFGNCFQSQHELWCFVEMAAVHR